MAGGRIGLEVSGPSGECFRLTDYLGQGAFGEVYRAVGVDSGRVVAVKLLPVNELEMPDVRVALLNEAQLATQVVHPNVVQVLHVERGSSSEVGPYLVMEYVAGGTLARLLRSQQAAAAPIALARAREMMIDIAQGARAINERLIHRDIKPDNILLDGPRLKISDFGISKVVDERTRTQTFKGGQHILYMAPEGWEGATNTFKLDVYSVGLVFHELLTLHHPLAQAVTDRGDWQAWRRVHLFAICPDVRKLREDVGLPLAQLLARMVAKRPQDRPAWDEVLGIVASSDEPPPNPSRVAGAVEAALTREQEIRKATLAAAEAAEREAQKEELYHHSCERLVELFDRIIAEFNSQYQHGRIEVQRGHRTGRTYRLPTGGAIECEFFPRRETDIRVAGGRLVGGGYLGAVRGLSANLLLVREADDDLYGRWAGCLVRISAIVDARKLLGSRGLTRETVIPFGFRAPNDFYEEIRWAIGGVHVFTYEITSDMEQLFADILEAALKGPPEKR